MLRRDIRVSKLLWLVFTIAAFIALGFVVPETEPIVWGGSFWRLCAAFLSGRYVHMLGVLLVLFFFGGVIFVFSAVVGWLCSAITAVVQALSRSLVARHRAESQ